MNILGAASVQHPQRLGLQTAGGHDMQLPEDPSGAQPDHDSLQHTLKLETTSTTTGGTEGLETACVTPSNCDMQDIKGTLSFSLNKQCPVCSILFRNIGSLKNHFKKTHFNVQFLNCICCNEKMSGNFESYLEHCKIHYQDGEASSSLEDQAVKTRECRECRKQVRSAVYSRHLATHNKVPCPECKALIVPHSLKRHVNDCHTREISYPCYDCSAVYHDASNLLSHRKRNHLGQEARRHLCDVCGKKFITPSDLRTHVTGVHHKVKKFVCEFCGLSFKISSALTYHRRLHTGERPHVCEVCGRTFMKPNGLAKHVRRVHRVEYHGKYRKRLHTAEPPSRGSLKQSRLGAAQAKRDGALVTLQVPQMLDDQRSLTEDISPGIDEVPSQVSESGGVSVATVYSLGESWVMQMAAPVVVRVPGTQPIQSISYLSNNIEDRALARTYDASQPLHTIAHFRQSSEEQHTVSELLLPQEPPETRSLDPTNRAYVTPTHSSTHQQ